MTLDFFLNYEFISKVMSSKLIPFNICINIFLQLITVCIFIVPLLCYSLMISFLILVYMHITWLRV